MVPHEYVTGAWWRSDARGRRPWGYRVGCGSQRENCWRASPLLSGRRRGSTPRRSRTPRRSHPGLETCHAPIVSTGFSDVWLTATEYRYRNRRTQPSHQNASLVGDHRHVHCCLVGNLAAENLERVLHVIEADSVRMQL